ncbi:MAG: hypothetical protein M1816_002808 [Peltula sp. TS41687]|nr:MAG: hypothetical protein M1816_002808 [Peltula sp. TS41687]
MSAALTPQPCIYSSCCQYLRRIGLQRARRSSFTLFHSSATARSADDNSKDGQVEPQQSVPATAAEQHPPKSPSNLSALSRLLDQPGGLRATSPAAATTFDYDSSLYNPENMRTPKQLEPPHHLHVFATKHNTHITLTRPNRDPIISVAAGNIGFKKAARGSYDAAYQLSAWVMNQMHNRGVLREINELEVIFRGYGAGREAVSKVLLGVEGKSLRERVVRVTDATRLKFGGTRSEKPRRLG